MKTTLFTLLTAVVAYTIAAPLAVGSKIPVKTITRSAFQDSKLAEYDSMIKAIKLRRSDPIADSVNYILVVQASSDTTDAYQDEVDAADEASVLGKRADPIADSVNYILVVQASSDTTDAYQDEVDAADEASVLGKRADPIADSVNYILVVQASSDTTDAYQDEVDAATPADVLG